MKKYWRTDMITHTVPVMYYNTLIPTHTLKKSKKKGIMKRRFILYYEI